MIGISLSKCIEEIAAGKVAIENVEKIVAATSVNTEEAIEDLLRDYSEIYWRGHQDKAKEIFGTLLAAGKIEQPRLANNNHYPITYGYETEPFTIWVSTESEIRWSDKDR